jgi:hypothetical protein
MTAMYFGKYTTEQNKPLQPSVDFSYVLGKSQPDQYQ